MAQVQDVPEVIETPTESPAEIKENVEEPSQGGEQDLPDNTPDVEDNIPFHKHPRWIAKQRELEEMREKLSEIETIKQEFSQFKQQNTSNEPEMPEWWVESFGNDDASRNAWKKQVEHEQKLYQDWESRILEKVKTSEAQEAKQQADAVAKYEAEIENKIFALQEKGYKFNKNELLKVVEEYSTDETGKFSGVLIPFEKAYQILQLKKSIPSTTDKVRQKAADLSVQNTSSGIKTNNVPSLSEIREKGWGAWRNVI